MTFKYQEMWPACRDCGTLRPPQRLSDGVCLPDDGITCLIRTTIQAERAAAAAYEAEADRLGEEVSRLKGKKAKP